MTENDERKGGFMWLVSGVLLGAIVAVGGMTLTQRTRPAAIEILPPVPSPTLAPSATPGPLHVYVTGAVASPDVYELPVGSIVADAIQAAGDFSEEAAMEMVNLALPLSDGMQVHVPARMPDGEQAAGVVPESPLQPLATPPVVSSAVGANASLVNINTANAVELDTLPGVGPATAQNIIDHRKANGPFQAVEEIMEVSGIGPAKFEQMKALITVE